MVCWQFQLHGVCYWFPNQIGYWPASHDPLLGFHASQAMGQDLLSWFPDWSGRQSYVHLGHYRTKGGFSHLVSIGEKKYSAIRDQLGN